MGSFREDRLSNDAYLMSLKLLIHAAVECSVNLKLHKHGLLDMIGKEYDRARDEYIKTVHDMVFGELDNALANGSFEEGEELYMMTAEYIAGDLIMWSAAAENYQPEELIYCIKDWLSRHKNETGIKVDD